MMKFLLALIFVLTLAYPVHASWVAGGLGSDDRVVFSSNAALAFADGDWTVSLWFRVTNNTGTSSNTLVGTNASATANPNFQVICYETSHANGGRAEARFNDDNGTDKFLLTGTGTLFCNILNTWQHLLVKRESDALYIWIDGVQRDSTGADAAVDTHAAVDWYFFVSPGLTNDIAAQVCDIAKWNRALTADEIGALSQGMSASHFLRGLEVWAPAIGDYQEVVVPLTVTNTNTTVGKCPRMYYPQ